MTDRLFDCHTHRTDAPAGCALVNLPDGVLDRPAAFCPPAGMLCSAGLHPWYLTDEAAARRLAGLEALLRAGRLAAVGECGLDWLTAAPRGLQLRCFEAQAVLAARYGRPLVIHCVRAWDDLLRLRRLHPSGRWIVHGFRGGGAHAAMLLRAGLSLGFGPAARDEALRLCPPERLFPETDEAGSDSLVPLYARIAALTGTVPQELARRCRGVFAGGSPF